MRGGESVLEAILELVPQAEIFTLVHTPGSVSHRIEQHAIHTAWTDRLAGISGDYRRLLPLFPLAIESFDLSRFDLIVSSSHCVAKGVRVKSGQPHLSYCHTPMRYMWDLFDDYFPRRRPLVRAAGASLRPLLQRWDARSARRVTRFIANSTFVAERIRRFYDREASVIHPFVDGAFLAAPVTEARDEFHLVISALVPYKRVEVAVEAAKRAGRQLVVVGDGPMLGQLRESAPPGVEFRGRIARSELIELLVRARSLILPGIEDFGITPLEAMACGTPVVALGDGGVLDSVSDGVTGILVRGGDPDDFAAALDAVERIEWDRAVLRRRAAGFSRQRFLGRFGEELQSLIAK